MLPLYLITTGATIVSAGLLLAIHRHYNKD